MSPCLLVSLKEKGLSQERQTFVNLYDKYLHGFATHDFWILSCTTTMLLSLILFSSVLLLFVGKSKHFISNCKIFCQKFYKKLTSAEISALVLSAILPQRVTRNFVCLKRIKEPSRFSHFFSLLSCYFIYYVYLCRQIEIDCL